MHFLSSADHLIRLSPASLTTSFAARAAQAACPDTQNNTTEGEKKKDHSNGYDYPQWDWPVVALWRAKINLKVIDTRELRLNYPIDTKTSSWSDLEFSRLSSTRASALP